jgi:hypothetical protein
MENSDEERRLDGTFQLPQYDTTDKSASFAVAIFRQYLTEQEALQISQQFRNTWSWGNQVLWSGLLFEDAQKWAKDHDKATLTMAMGPLMTPRHPLCLKKKKTSVGWSKYVKGASAIFAWHIWRGERVTVLLPPPPERFHPSGQTNYQAIEEPILKQPKTDGTRVRLEVIHPNVLGAENFIYQMWPDDETNTWIERFGFINYKERIWRKVKGFQPETSCSKLSNSKEMIGRLSEVILANKVKLEEKARSTREKVLNGKGSKDNVLKTKLKKKKKANRVTIEKVLNRQGSKDNVLKTKLKKKKKANRVPSRRC